MKTKSRLQKLYIVALLGFMYIPILLVIIYSFNDSRISSLWHGFTFQWYVELFRDRTMFSSLMNSLILGVLSSLSAAVIGTSAAVGFYGNSRRPVLPAGRVMEYLSILPIMIPEIILGMVFLAFFSLLGLPPGMLTLVIAHTAFCTPYVYLLVKARLEGIEKSYVEAAMDLGAGEWRAFLDITFPLILPALISGVLLSFAMSFDDVIISVFVTGVNTNTLPIKIYSQIKTGITPKTNAMCTLLFAATVILSLISAAISRLWEKLEAGPRKADASDTISEDQILKGELL